MVWQLASTCLKASGNLAKVSEPFMKALLQQLETGLYFQAPGEWAPEYEKAHDFKSSITARTYCLSHGIEGVQIVLKFEMDRYDIVLAAHQPKY